MISVRKTRRYAWMAYPCNKTHCCTFSSTYWHFTKSITYSASILKSNFGIVSLYTAFGTPVFHTVSKLVRKKQRGERLILENGCRSSTFVVCKILAKYCCSWPEGGGNRRPDFHDSEKDEVGERLTASLPRARQWRTLCWMVSAATDTRERSTDLTAFCVHANHTTTTLCTFTTRHRASTSTRWHFAFGAMLS